MAQKPTNRFKKQNAGGSRYAALAIIVLILLVVVGYWIVRPSSKTVQKIQEQNNNLSTVETVKPPKSIHEVSTPNIIPPNSLSSKTVPSLLQQKKDSTASSLNSSKIVLPSADNEDSKPPLLNDHKVFLAIIIDDMGSSLKEAQTLFSIGTPLTFSIIPGLRNYKEVANFAEKNGIESMIHIPMQSKGWPQRRLEVNGLLISMDEAVITSRIQGFIQDIPNAVGVNNHMGSEFTEHADKMKVVLSLLKERNLFFVDSITTPKSTGLQIAKELGIKSARRSVFLDNEQNENYIHGQLNQAVRQAQKHGGVIAICHPHPATIAALTKFLPALKKQGITLVSASKLVQ